METAKKLKELERERMEDKEKTAGEKEDPEKYSDIAAWLDREYGKSDDSKR